MKAVKIGLGVSLLVNFVLGVMWLNSQKENVRETVLTTPTIRQQSALQEKKVYEIESAEFVDGSFKTIRVNFSSALGEFGESVVRVAGKKHGATRWLGSHQAELDLDEPLRTEESVSLDLDPEFCPEGWEQGKKTNLSVQTEAFKLLSCEQTESYRNYSIVTLKFNSKCVREELAKHLVLYERNKYLDWSIQSMGEDYVKLHVQKKGERKFHVKLRKELKNAYGSTLKSNFIKSLHFDEELKITRVEAKNYYNNLYFLISSNLHFDLAKAKDFISVEPEVDFYLEKTWRGLELNGEFEPKRQYKFTFKKALAANSGQSLSKDQSFTVLSKDYEPRINVLSRSLYLPENYEGLLPCRVTNLEKVQVNITRIFNNNLIPYLRTRSHLGRFGKTYSEKVIELGVGKNKKEVMNLPMAELLKSSPRGLYVMDFDSTDSRNYSVHDRVTVIRTDLALSVTESANDVEVFVSSLGENKALEGVKVTFYSYQNQVLAKVKTDEQGLARVKLDEKAHLITAQTKDDFSFIEKIKHQLDQSQFSLGGRWQKKEAYEAAVYATRALCRPGEEISFSGTVRKLDGSLPEDGLPIELVLKDARDKVILKKLVKANAQGVIHERLTLDQSANLGRYDLSLRQPGIKDSEWGKAYFRVAAYQPDRFKTSLKADLEKLQSDAEFELKASAQYYFGRPVADAPVTLNLTYSELDFSHNKYADYSFVDDEVESDFGLAKDQNVVRVEVTSDSSLLKAMKDFQHQEKASLSEDGEKVFKLTVPEKIRARSAVAVYAELDTQSASGRTVTARTRFNYFPHDYYFGLKDSGAEEGKRHFDFVKIDYLGEKLDLSETLQAELLREDWHYVYKEGDYGLHWDWQKKVSQVKSFELKPNDLVKGRFTVGCPASGVYILRVSNSLQSTAIRFYHEFGDDELRLKAPEYLKLNLNAKNYKAGDEAELSFYAYEDGFVYLRLLQDRLLHSQSVAVKKGENTIKFTVPKVKYENVHVAVTLQHDRKKGGRKLPRRLFGLTQLKLKHDDKRLAVKIINQEVLRSGKKAHLAAEVLNHKGEGQEASVHLFAVDRGLLALRRYGLIDQKAFFYGSRYWENEYSDIFDSVYPDEILTYRKGTLFGGGGALPIMSKFHTKALSRDKLTLDDLKMEKTTFIDLGVYQSNAAGYVEQEIDIPEFNGELVFFAVAVADDAFGEASSSAIVRDPITVQTQSPSHLLPKDQAVLKLVLFNNTDLSKTVALDWKTTPLLKLSSELPKSIKLKSKEEQVLNIPVEALETTGPCLSTVRVKSGDYDKEFKLHSYIRSAVVRESRSQSLALKAGEKRKFFLAKDWHEGTAMSNIAIASNPFVKLNNYASFLNQYPYGCLEQTVSKAFPQLFLETLEIKGQNVAVNQELQVEAAIKKILSLYRTSDGAFAMWQGNRETWHEASIYAAHFLAEAMSHTYEVPESDMKVIIRYLKSVVKGKYGVSDFNKAYALYVLASLGHGENILAEELLRNEKVSKRARLAAAASLIRTGRSNLVEKHLADIRKSTVKVKGFDDLRFRREDLLWEVICELEMEGDKEMTASQLQGLVDELDESGFYVTYKSSMLIFACGRWAERYGLNNDPAFIVSFNGEEPQAYRKSFVKRMENDSGDFVTIENTSDRDLHLTWQGSGSPKEFSTEAQGKFLQIERSYLDSKGLRKKDFKVGDLVTVSLKIKSDRFVSNAVIVDLLPGAFRIEDNSLATRAKGKKKVEAMMVNHSEELDDRLLIFANLKKSNRIEYSYQVRVVAEGSFAIPSASVESMYKPELSARSEIKGMITVAK